MKKFIIIVLIVLFSVTNSFAIGFDDFKILNKEEILKLSDEQLVDVYTQCMIERKANEIFYGKAGFTPKEYKLYKDLLFYNVTLRREMSTRAMEIPPVEEWLK